MIGSKSVLAVVPARGGSKGIPRKNIRAMAGKPLIAWTLEAAAQSKYIDEVVVSTDDQEIADVAASLGFPPPFLRPAELAQDATPGIDPILHALDQRPGHGYVMMLQPTSPQRLPEDIDGCVETLIRTGAPAAVSMAEAHQNPYWMYRLGEGEIMETFMKTDVPIRRQDLPTLYHLNGSVYIAEAGFVRERRSFLTESTAGFVMPVERSLDLDTPFDWRLCELVLQGA